MIFFNGIIYFRLVTHLYRMNTFYWIAGVKTPCYFYLLRDFTLNI